MLKRAWQWLEEKNMESDDGLIAGVIIGLIGGLIGGLIYGLIVGLIGGLIGGLIFGLIFGLGWCIGVILAAGLIWLVSYFGWLPVVVTAVVLAGLTFLFKKSPGHQSQ